MIKKKKKLLLPIFFPSKNILLKKFQNCYKMKKRFMRKIINHDVILYFLQYFKIKVKNKND
jgi:hypothetical protein